VARIDTYCVAANLVQHEAHDTLRVSEAYGPPRRNVRHLAANEFALVGPTEHSDDERIVSHRAQATRATLIRRRWAIAGHCGHNRDVTGRRLTTGY
jgi:hypothetical protein